MYKTDRKKTVVLLFAFILTAIFSITTVHASKSEAPRYTIQITLNDAVAIGILDNTPTTRDFVAQLPLTVKLDDYSATEKITYLPNKLTTQSTPSGITPHIGDITYYAPWGNIAIFYQNFSYSHGLIKMGEITHGLEHFHYRGSRQATIELVDKN